MLPHITKDMVGEFESNFQLYRKKTLTRVVKMEGTFEVVTREGWLTRHDGYLAFDNQDWPYPISKDELEETYEIAK